MSVPTSIAMNAYASAARQVTNAAGPDDALPTGASGGGQGFGDMLKGVVENMASTGINAEQQAAASISGSADIVDVVTSVAEAEATLQTVVAVRDKVLIAYQEIMKMPI